MSDLMSKPHGQVRANAPAEGVVAPLTPHEEAEYAARADEMYGLNRPIAERLREAREAAKDAPVIRLPVSRARRVG
jgi:hypothetical protein